MGGIGGALASGELVGQSIRLPAIAFYTRLLPACAERSSLTVSGLTPLPTLATSV